jgi:hypothetical protein
VASPRPSEAVRLRALARLTAERQLADARYRRHPWPFVAECAVTLDQIHGGPRPFPSAPTDPVPACPCAPDGCGSYLHHLVNVWYTTPRLLVPKSRRLLVTWTLLACHWWLARYRPGTFVAIVARKLGTSESEGSAELVRRVKWLEAHLPPHVARPAVEERFGGVRWPEIDSEIVAVGQGADQLRQYTVTAIFADECAFWEEAEGTYAASLPTIQGGGRLTMVSSANPGFFAVLVHDRL